MLWFFKEGTLMWSRKTFIKLSNLGLGFNWNKTRKQKLVHGLRKFLTQKVV
jgi:hypothetical protein